MSRLGVIPAALGTFVLLVTLAVGFGWFVSEPRLDIYLGCDKTATGTLSIAIVSENGESGRRERFDLATRCRSGGMETIELDGYRYGESLHSTLERLDGEVIELSSEYGRDIQSGRDNFYVVIDITNAPPFIANDRI